MSLSRLTARVMACPVAAAWFSQLSDASRELDIDALVDQHTRLLTHNDKQSHERALAVEYYLRNLVTYGFGRSEIVDAVSAIDRNLDAVATGRTGRRIKNSTRSEQILSGRFTQLSTELMEKRL